ncbi:MAG: hypothetical protein EB023_03550 [Flavobacteriia bacterium]|nr:hypothetical protein [Flavobacteriia bacterium]
MKTITFSGLVLGCILTMAFVWNVAQEEAHFVSAPKNAGGAAPGKTGAPGEGNCTQCHAGSVLDGTSENVLTILNGVTPVSSYIPGQQYNVNLLMSSNPVKRGFQATALTSANAMAGAFTGQAGNTSINGGTKKYANHTSTSNTSAAAPSWTWTWTAPSAGTGDVTFYVASNKTNNNGNDNGDMIYLSQVIVQEESGSGIQEESQLPFKIIGIGQESIQISAVNDVNMIYGVSIHNAEGKILQVQPLVKMEQGAFSVSRPTTMRNGLFFITFQTEKKLVSLKISI